MLWENHDNQNKDKLFKENQVKMNRSFSNNRGKISFGRVSVLYSQ